MTEDNSPDEVIYEIAQTTARTEERARNIQRDVTDLKVRYVEEATLRDEKIDGLENRVQKHEVILTGGLVTIGGALSTFVGKLLGLIKL